MERELQPYCILYSRNLHNDDDNHIAADSMTRMGDDTVDEIANDVSVLPQHIKAYIEDVLLSGTLLELSQQQQQPQLLHITNVTTFRSAQQQIYLVQLDYRNSQQNDQNESFLPSKKNKTTYVPFPSTIESCQSSMLVDAICKGNNYIVIKIWTGTSRWWNCHHIETAITHNSNNNKKSITTVSPMKEDEGISSKQKNHSIVDDQNKNYIQQQQQLHIAQQEMIGYRTAYEIFTNIQNEILVPTSVSSNINASSTIIRIPRVLYSSINNTSTYDLNINWSTCTRQQPPWCVLEYVGPYSNSWYDHHHWIQYDTSYVDAMITTRMEYGFDESHLRWGRLPIDLCIPYTVELLNAFVIPLHIHYFTSAHQRSNNEIQILTDTMNIYYFDSMIELLKSKYTCYIEPNIPKKSENDEESKYATMLSDASQILKTAINTIYEVEVVPSSIQSLPPVLCHMDLQPQNLIFAVSSSSSSEMTPEEGGITSVTSSPKPNRCQFLSVLDWEEAAYADPRFELLLLCRKVCANRDQAEYIWQYYSDQVNERLTRYESHHPMRLGSITPWLKLEAIHSITTMLLECVAGGGRGNGKPGFRNDHGTNTLNNDRSHNNVFVLKLQREIRRLYSLGYTFCTTDHWCLVEANDSIIL